MTFKSPKDLFLLLLSNVRHGTERSTKIYKELNEIAEDKEVKEILDARVFLSDKILATLDEVFKIIGEKPVKTSGRLHDVFVEDFRRELEQIEGPVARRLFALAKAQHLIHLRIGEYQALIAAADMTGNYEVGLLLESCLADKMVMVERVRRLIRHLVENRVTAKKAAMSA